MVTSLHAVLWSLAALGCGLMAGVFAAFSLFVMRGLGALPPAEGAGAMQGVNRAALRPPFMALFFGTALACAAAAVTAGRGWAEPGAMAALAGALVYLAGGLGLTAVCNVPLNERLAAVKPGTPEASALWAHYLVAWTRWNHLRLAASAAAALLLGAGAAGWSQSP
jgi:uncharacterized membrane protein